MKTYENGCCPPISVTKKLFSDVLGYVSPAPDAKTTASPVRLRLWLWAWRFQAGASESKGLGPAWNQEEKPRPVGTRIFDRSKATVPEGWGGIGGSALRASATNRKFILPWASRRWTHCELVPQLH